MNTRIVTTTSSKTPWQGADRSSCVRSSKSVATVIETISGIMSEKNEQGTSAKKQACGTRPVRPMNARSAFAVSGFFGGCSDTQEGDPRSAAW